MKERSSDFYVDLMKAESALMKAEKFLEKAERKASLHVLGRALEEVKIARQNLEKLLAISS